MDNNNNSRDLALSVFKDLIMEVAMLRKSIDELKDEIAYNTNNLVHINLLIEKSAEVAREHPIDWDDFSHIVEEVDNQLERSGD